MGRKTRNNPKTAAAQDAPAVEESRTDFVQQFLDEGTVTLTAKTREEIAAMTAEIPYHVRYAAGGVSFDILKREYFVILTLTSKDTRSWQDYKDRTFESI